MIPKFRAYLNMHKKIVDVQEINYKHKEIVWLNGKYTEVDNFVDIELLQSTELFDKNGKEIFEGDILKYRDEYRVVEMYDGAWVARTGEKQLIVKMVVLSGAEIIGNKFENRELLDYDSE